MKTNTNSEYHAFYHFCRLLVYIYQNKAPKLLAKIM